MSIRNKLQTAPLTLTLTLLLAVTFFPGCFDNEDIDRRMIVTPVGIDANPNAEIKVTYRMPIIQPAGDGQGNQSSMRYVTRSALSHSNFSAFMDIQKRNELTLFLGHCRSIIIGEAMAKRGLRPVLDFFNRMPTFPPNAFVTIAQPTAEQLLKINWPLQTAYEQNYRLFFSNRSNQNYGVKLWMLFWKIEDPLQDPLVPMVASSDENSTMKLTGLAVFRNNRMVGELTTEESNLCAILLKPNKENALVIPTNRSTPISFQVVKGRKRLKATYQNHPLFKLELKLKAFIGEIDGFKTGLSQRELRQLEFQSAHYLQQQYEALLYKLQALKSDPLNLGNTFRIQQPKYFSLAKWPQEYQEAEFRVNVKVTIERLGVLK